MSEQSHSLKPYALVLLALFGLTAATVGAAVIDFGKPWSDLVALAIALSKATLVVLFFMHVKGSTSVVKLTVLGGVFWLAILFVFTLCDYLTRSFVFVGG